MTTSHAKEINLYSTETLQYLCFLHSVTGISCLVGKVLETCLNLSDRSCLLLTWWSSVLKYAQTLTPHVQGAPWAAPPAQGTGHTLAWGCGCCV